MDSRLRQLSCLLILLLSTLLACSQPVIRTELTLNAIPKYPEHFSHFDYVNPNAPKGGDLRMAGFGTFDSLNPFLDHGTPAVGLDQVYESLAQRSEDEAFSLYPLLAQSFEFDPDHFSWIIFHLNPKAHFSNGAPLRARDVVFSYHALTEQGDPGYRVMFSAIRSATILDPETVRFDFKGDQDRTLPLLLASQLPVLSADFYQTHPFNQTTLNPSPGSGPYKISSVDPGRSISYLRDPNYWGRDLAVNQGCYNVGTITYLYYRDAVVAMEAFKAGQYDFRIENKAKNWAKLYRFPAVREGWVHKEAIRNHNPAGMQGFVFNTRRPVFKDVRVREALAQAFDFEWSNRFLFYGAYHRNDSYFANSELAAPQGPLPLAVATLLGPYRKQLPASVFQGVRIPVSDGHGSDRNNLIYAQKLLEQAGYRVHDSTLFGPDGHPLTFEILNMQPDFDRIIEPFMRNLEKLGIHARLRDVDISQYINRMRSFDFDMTVTTFPESLTPGNEQSNFWSSQAANSTGSQNLAGVHSPVVDDLINRILQAPDRADLILDTQALDRVLMAGWYVIPQFYVDSYRVAYWDFLRRPKIAPAYAIGMETWWIDQAREQDVRAHQGGD